MDLRIEVADATSLLGRINAAVSAHRIPGWRRAGNSLITTIDGADIAFAAMLDLPARHVRGGVAQFLVFQATDSAERSKISDAVTRLEVAIRNRFVAPNPAQDPIDDFGPVIAEFVIRE